MSTKINVKEILEGKDFDFIQNMFDSNVLNKAEMNRFINSYVRNAYKKKEDRIEVVSKFNETEAFIANKVCRDIMQTINEKFGIKHTPNQVMEKIDEKDDVTKN